MSSALSDFLMRFQLLLLTTFITTLLTHWRKIIFFVHKIQFGSNDPKNQPKSKCIQILQYFWIFPPKIHQNPLNFWHFKFFLVKIRGFSSLFQRFYTFEVRIFSAKIQFSFLAIFCWKWSRHNSSVFLNFPAKK